MEFKKVWAVYWSATGTTEKIAACIAQTLAEKLNAPLDTFDFTLPEARGKSLCFTPEDLVVFATPVYAGRVPNVLLKYLIAVEGSGAAAIPVVSYGNRNYDDALIELRDILEQDGFYTLAAAAFIGEHSFSRILAKDRPDEADLQIARTFAGEAARKIQGLSCPPLEPIYVKGDPRPYRTYYQPRDRAGNPVDIRKVKPLTNEDCDNCGLCARICPMGSIDPENARQFTGICIKCGACIKRCPRHAKYYEDAGYLYHQHELEEGYTRRAEPELFL